MSMAGSTSSTNATCLFRNWRQSIRRLVTPGGLPWVPGGFQAVPEYQVRACVARAAKRGAKKERNQSSAPFCSRDQPDFWNPRTLVCFRLDDRRERVPCPVQPRLHRTQVAVRDLGDLLI